MTGKRVRWAAWPVVALVGSALLAGPALADDDEDDFRDRAARVYRITITNITKGQVFSPPAIVTHDSSVQLFELGERALDELAIVAEDGDGVPLVTLLRGLPGVSRARATSSPILPGESAVLRIRGGARFPLISIVSMMVNTNDAFLALDSLAVPRSRGGESEQWVIGYDAGSEGNNEDCAFVPGPACPGDSGNARDVEGAEHYVHVHNGVHGIADLEPDAYDWRNPVALIGVKRIR